MVYISVPLEVNGGNSVFAAECRKEIDRDLQPKLQKGLILEPNTHFQYFHHYFLKSRQPVKQ